MQGQQNQPDEGDCVGQLEGDDEGDGQPSGASGRVSMSGSIPVEAYRSLGGGDFCRQRPNLSLRERPRALRM
jgi:hypothetical protein